MPKVLTTKNLIHLAVLMSMGLYGAAHAEMVANAVVAPNSIVIDKTLSDDSDDNKNVATDNHDDKTSLDGTNLGSANLNSTNLANIVPPSSTTVSISEIESKLAAAMDDGEYYEQKAGFLDTKTGYASETATPISHINDTAVPIGLDVAVLSAQFGNGQITNTQTTNTQSANAQTAGGQANDNQSADSNQTTQSQTAQNQSSQNDSTAGLNPDSYLPTYEETAQTATTTISDETPETAKEPNFVKRLYNKVFRDGADSLPRLDVSIYTQAKSDDAGSETTPRQKVDEKAQPYANIKAALSQITQESALDFRSAAPRMREAAEAAARAVGYYDVDFTLANRGGGKIDVLMHDVGKPVLVTSQIIDIRGQGANDDVFVAVKDTAKPQVNEVFHHGDYTATKTSIESLKNEHGYFEGQWLNSYVDVLLPDNTADINLVYDTGDRYAFDEVVFYTFDPTTRTLTADPDKLPVKPELLRRLLTFETGDPYSRSKVNALSNELLATRYFNAANVETILPNLEQDNDDGIDFETKNKDNTPSETDDNQDTANQGTTMTLDDGVVAEISPIDFSPSQELLEKLNLVTAKAERLYNSPDDRLLSGDANTPTSLLGKVSNMISRVAKAILPDESGDELPELPEGVAPPVLADKKTADAVYQDKKVPLYVFVVADKPRDSQIGIGYGSDTGVRLTGKFEHNLINRSGYQAGVQLSGSAVEKNATAYISRPLSHPINDKLTASVTYEEEKIDQNSAEYTMSSRTVGAGLSRNIIRPSGWNQTYSIRYRLDELETNAPRHLWQDLPVQFAENRPTQEAILAGFALSKTVQDNMSEPRRGYRQYYSLSAGVDGVMTDTNMAIVRAGVGGIYSFGDNAYGKDRAHQLVGRLDAGYIWADDFRQVPYKLRFFAGGDQSLRGYNYESLSPVSPNGYLTGGQALAIASLEYNYEVKEGIRAAVFADVGNAYDKDFSNGTKVGAGVGVRWASPVGSVRVDLATGVGEKDKSIRLHFMIGSPF